MREQGRTTGAKANTLHHTHKENIHMHIPISKQHRCMPSHVFTPRETPRRKDTRPHTHALTHSDHIILLYPGFSISPLCCLSLPSYLKSLLNSLYHSIISSSCSASFTPLILPSTPPHPSSLPKLAPCASNTCVMDSRESTSIDLKQMLSTNTESSCRKPHKYSCN